MGIFSSQTSQAIFSYHQFFFYSKQLSFWFTEWLGVKASQFLRICTCNWYAYNIRRLRKSSKTKNSNFKIRKGKWAKLENNIFQIFVEYVGLFAEYLFLVF